jgi:hypothetical protein
MPDTKDVIGVKRLTEKDVVFASRKDLETFYDELEQGKWLIITYVNGMVTPPVRVGVMIAPTLLNKIKDGLVTLSYEELEKVK